MGAQQDKRRAAAAGRRQVLLTCTLAAFTGYLCLLFLTPIYPQVAHDLGLTAATLGLVIAIAPALSALANIPAGVAADALGRRPLLVAGSLLLVAANLLRWQASTAPLFAASGLLLGLAIPCVASAAFAAVADAFPATGRVQAIATVTASISLGQGAGFVITALLAPVLGWHGLALALTPLPLGVLALSLRLPAAAPPRPNASVGAQLAAAVAYLARPRNAAAAVVQACLNGAGVSATFLLPFAALAAGLTTGATSALLLAYLAGAVVAAPLAGRIADRVGPARPLFVTLILGAAGLAVFGLAGHSPPVVAVSYAMIGAGVAGSAALNTGQVVQAAGRSGTGTGSALGGLRFGQVLGPALLLPVAAAVFERGGLTRAVLLLIGMMLTAMILTAVAAPARLRGAPQPPPQPRRSA